MLNFELYNPVKIVFGPGESKRVGNYAKDFGKKAMLVSYEEHSFFTDLLNAVKKNLEDNGVQVTEFYKVQANPLLSHIRQAIDICRQEKVDMVIAVGGGSVMDSTKIIAAGVLYPDDPWKMFVCRHDIEVAVPPTETLPTILIPTLPATSSEMNCIGVATNDETKEKAYVYTPVIYSKISIVDPELTCSLPAFQTAAGAIDAISHVLESYFNGDQHSPVQDRTQEGLVKAIMDELPLVLKDPKNVQHRANIQWASTLCWNGWMQAGLNAQTPMHNMGHILSAQFNVTHGVTLAIFMRSFFRYTANLNEERAARFAQLGQFLFGLDRSQKSDKEVANEFIDRFVAFMDSVGVPNTFTQLKQVCGIEITEKDFDMIADEIVRLGCDANGNLPSIPAVGRDGIMQTLKLSI